MHNKRGEIIPAIKGEREVENVSKRKPSFSWTIQIEEKFIRQRSNH